ncbi:MAG TPA: ferrous iron transport protein A, partial [Bacteroidetes bacterium]|nr:ferrous iron transport protein A [Bacteroidota bacterium]
NLKKGEKAVVVGISQECKGESRRRLLDLGVVKGTDISIDITSPLNDPKGYLIRNTVIAFRNEQAANILIEKNKNNEQRNK